MNIGIVIGLIKALAPGVDTEIIEQAVMDWLDDHPEATTTVQDGSITEAKLAQDVLADLAEIPSLKEAIVPLTPSATSGDVGKFMKVKTVSGGKVTAYEFGSAGGGGSVDLFYVTPEDYGAVGDGETDDSEAVQAACDAGYAVYFASNKTYYLASTVTIDHDCHLFGGENTVIKTETPSGGSAYNGIKISGTLKKTTTLTSDYVSNGTTEANCNNKFTLTDMTDIAIGDIMVITATDQHYNYSRPYYYLGATLLVTEIYDGHIYTSDSMPWNIENTEDVSVQIYSAPSATVENLSFESDGFNGGNYKYMLSLIYCNGASVRDCKFTNMPNGINVKQCVNTLIDNVSLSKSKYDNELEGDGYGMVVDSCTNTIIERIIATCAQHAISVTGQLPSINTYIRNCELTSECRVPALDTHEAVYNMVVEDCTLGTACLNAVCTINRCKVINNRRLGTGTQYISIYGSHNPEWAKIRISDTVFDGTGISITYPGVQNPVQAFDHIIDSIEITNCFGGELVYVAPTTQYILSNTINRLIIKNWRNAERIYHETDSGIIKYLEIKDTSFNRWNCIGDNTAEHGLVLDGIEQIKWFNSTPEYCKDYANRTVMADKHTMPENYPIYLSANSQTAKFRICGANITPNTASDYLIGNVSGNDGAALVRTVASTPPGTLSTDSNGNLVYTQGSNSSEATIYPIGMYLVTEWSIAKISATLKNTGETTGAKYRFYIAVVDGKTGMIVERRQHGATQASAEGANIEHESYRIKPGDVVLPYIYCSTPVAGAVTTFEDFVMDIAPVFAPHVVGEKYTAKYLTGSGTVLSLPGVNNICCSEDTFEVRYWADYVNNPIGLLPSAQGVSF